MTSPHHLIASSRVEGAPVFGHDGERLGKIDDVMIDKTSGKAAYALMAFDGFLGVGERFYPLPWSVLTYDAEKEGYVTSLTRAEVEEGRSVPDKEINDEIEWRDALHAHYGAWPYWLPALS